MLRLENVTKIYNSLNGEHHQALRNINLSLPEKGMVFVLGKSGSGKTTLLNILGFLDSPSSGNVYLNDEMLIINDKTSDTYRNRYSGFVFQEFYLLENETVEKNIALALQMQNVKDTKTRVNKALDEVGLSGYNKRMPFELSGGEKQRVAIARAIVKNPKIILADEPTGNLDSETGESIFQLLKHLASEKLVLVVTHDRDFAQRYGDRIIEIKDGEVIADNTGDEISPLKEDDNNYEIIKPSFPTGLAFKMGLSNLGKKKAKTILTIFIAILTIFSLAFSQSLISFSAEKALAKTINENDIEYIGIYHNLTQELVTPISEWNYFTHDDYGSSFQDKDLLIKKINNHFVINSKEQLESFGIEFHYATELTDDNVFISDFLLDRNIYYGMQVSEDGENFSRYDETIHSYEWMIGKTVRILNVNRNDYKIAGIIKTGYQNFVDDTFELYKTMQPPYTNEKLYFARQKFLDNYYFNSIYCTENYLKQMVDKIILSGGSKIEIYNGKNTIKPNELNISNTEAEVHNILTSQTTLQSLEQMDLSENEIVISMDLYNFLFTDQLSFNDYVEEDIATAKFNVIKYPDNLGIKIKLNVTDIKTSEVFFNNREFIITGVIMDPNPGGETTQEYIIHADKTVFKDIGKLALRNDRTLVKLNGDEDETLELLNNLRDKYNIVTDFEYSQPIYDNEQTQRNLGYTFLVFGIIMAILTILIMISLISFSIVRQTKEIGILRAMGAKIKDVMRIYLFESFFVSLVVFIFGLILTIVGITLNNIMFSSINLPNTTILIFSPLTLATLFISSIVFINLATLIPLKKVAKLKPIDAIKNINNS